MFTYEIHHYFWKTKDNIDMDCGSVWSNSYNMSITLTLNKQDYSKSNQSRSTILIQTYIKSFQQQIPRSRCSVMLLWSKKLSNSTPWRWSDYVRYSSQQYLEEWKLVVVGVRTHHCTRADSVYRRKAPNVSTAIENSQNGKYRH